MEMSRMIKRLSNCMIFFCIAAHGGGRLRSIGPYLFGQGTHLISVNVNPRAS
jgi:hypothetical protein